MSLPLCCLVNNIAQCKYCSLDVCWWHWNITYTVKIPCPHGEHIIYIGART
jgi:hypothetical protein